MRPFRAFLLGFLTLGAAPLDAPGTVAGERHADALARSPAVPPPPGHRIITDRSGRKEIGKASVYAHHFARRPMADGKRYLPSANVAASRMLPLGSTAKVTDLQTGRSAVVKVEDRGPFVDGRVVDLSPHVARQIGLEHQRGVAPVVVAPIAVPQRNGAVTAGAGASSLPQARSPTAQPMPIRSSTRVTTSDSQ